jgi:hypothetical protein
VFNESRGYTKGRKSVPLLDAHRDGGHDAHQPEVEPRHVLAGHSPRARTCFPLGNRSPVEDIDERSCSTCATGSVERIRKELSACSLHLRKLLYSQVDAFVGSVRLAQAPLSGCKLFVAQNLLGVLSLTMHSALGIRAAAAKGRCGRVGLDALPLGDGRPSVTASYPRSQGPSRCSQPSQSGPPSQGRARPSDVGAPPEKQQVPPSPSRHIMRQRTSDARSRGNLHCAREPLSSYNGIEAKVT